MEREDELPKSEMVGRYSFLWFKFGFGIDQKLLSFEFSRQERVDLNARC